MNIKQIALCATILACTSQGIFAATVEEIAQGIKNQTINIEDTVQYDGASYTLSEFDVTTNGEYECISFCLRMPSHIMRLNDGEFIVHVKCTKGIRPMYPHEEIKNSEAMNDSKYSIGVQKYWQLSDRMRYINNEIVSGLIMLLATGFVGTFLYKSVK